MCAVHIICPIRIISIAIITGNIATIVITKQISFIVSVVGIIGIIAFTRFARTTIKAIIRCCAWYRSLRRRWRCGGGGGSCLDCNAYANTCVFINNAPRHIAKTRWETAARNLVSCFKALDPNHFASHILPAHQVVHDASAAVDVVDRVARLHCTGVAAFGWPLLAGKGLSVGIAASLGPALVALTLIIVCVHAAMHAAA